MPTFNYDFKVPAQTKEEANSKMQSLCDLADKLNEKELAKLAYVVKHEPIKLALAKSALGV